MKRRDEESGSDLSLPLLLKTDNSEQRSAGPVWNFFQSLFSLAGGVTFVIGTGIYYFRVQHGASISALLYTIGSCCFVALDTMEIIAARKLHVAYRVNMALNWLGSALYLVGSVGFFPAVNSMSNQFSIQGFVWGSFCMGCSQIWYIPLLLKHRHIHTCNIYIHMDAHKHGFSPVMHACIHTQTYTCMWRLMDMVLLP
jgi:hypothetical protein